MREACFSGMISIAFEYLNGPKLRNCYRAVNVSCGPPGRRTLEHYLQNVSSKESIRGPKLTGLGLSGSLPN